MIDRQWGRIGMLTTSWPSRRIPYAGHFIRSMAEALGHDGAAVAIAAVQFDDDDGLLATPAIELVAHSVAGSAGALSSSPRRWWSVVRALRQSCRQVGHCDVWFAHWWPTLITLPANERAVTVLHGSDVDVLEQLPANLSRRITRWLVARSTVVGVADHLARRFNALCVNEEANAAICPLGAEPPLHGTLPEDARAWSEAPFRILTVARDAPGKGLAKARRAARHLPAAAWYIADGSPPLDPAQVWALVAHADLVVVPSEDGVGLPKEGMPYIIAQAFACGRPVLGGPNASVVEALQKAGQPCVVEHGWEALASAVVECIKDPGLTAIARKASAAGALRRWDMVLDRWYQHARAARSRQAG